MFFITLNIEITRAHEHECIRYGEGFFPPGCDPNHTNPHPDKPSNDDNESTTAAVDACTKAYDLAIGRVCNESSWSHLGKAAASFSSSFNTGDIKGACESAKTLNGFAGVVNTRFMNSCGGALTRCISTCEAEITRLEAELGVGAIGPGAAEIVNRKTQATTYLGVCNTKKTSNRFGGLAQIAQNAITFQSSGKCSEDAGSASSSSLFRICQGFPPSVQILCRQRGPEELCKSRPNLAACKRLNANQDNNENNIDPLDLEKLALEGCLRNPSGPECQSSICGSLPTAPLRDVCNTDGIKSLCKNIPGLTQCRSLTGKNGDSINCETLPSQNLANECRNSGANNFCERHSQLTACQNQNNKNSKLAGLAKTGGGGGSGGGGFFGGGGGAGGSKSGSGDLEEDSNGTEEIAAALEDRIYTGGEGSGSAGGAVGGRKGYRFSPGKFKPFNFKSLFGKKKKDQKRNVSSVDSKRDISSANGLSNFQKVSRHYKAKYPVFLGTKVQQAYKTF